MANYDLIYPGQTIDQLLTTAYYLKNAGYIFLGSASSYSGTPTQRAWLIAPSGFTGFGFSEAIPIGSIGICLFNGTSWSGVTINVVTVDETMSAGSDNPISSGAVYDVLSTITQGISAQLDSLELADATDPSDILDVLTVALKMTKGGFDVVVSSLDILSATASKAGLMSAADKIKLDGFLNNIRSMVFADTTPSSDLGTKIVESLKWTVDNVQEVITTLTILAASTEKAGLMSAADKAYVDGLPATLGTLTSELQDLLVSILSIVFADTTPTLDMADKIVETMKWTSGGIQRAITTLTILAASTEKAGLMSADDKAYVDGLPATLTSLSNSISSIRTDLLNYYYSKTEVDTLLDGKQNVIDDLASIRSGAAAGATAVQPAAIADFATTDYVGEAIDEAIDAIPVDEEPTAGSDNLVKSGGVFPFVGNSIKESAILASYATGEPVGFSVWEKKSLKTSSLSVGDTVTDADFDASNDQMFHMVIDLKVSNDVSIVELATKMGNTSSYKNYVLLDADYKVLYISTVNSETEAIIGTKGARYIVINNNYNTCSSPYVKTNDFTSTIKGELDNIYRAKGVESISFERRKAIGTSANVGEIVNVSMSDNNSIDCQLVHLLAGETCSFRAQGTSSYLCVAILDTSYKMVWKPNSSIMFTAEYTAPLECYLVINNTHPYKGFIFKGNVFSEQSSFKGDSTGVLKDVVGISTYAFKEGYFPCYPTAAQGMIMFDLSKEYRHCIISCAKDDVFTYKAYNLGTGLYRNYAIYDGNYTRIAESSAGDNTKTITCPEGSAYLVINADLSRGTDFFLTEGELMTTMSKTLQEVVEAMDEEEISVLSEKITGSYWNSQGNTAVLTEYETYDCYQPIEIDKEKVYYIHIYGEHSAKQDPVLIVDEDYHILQRYGTRDSINELEIKIVDEDAKYFLLTSNRDGVECYYKKMASMSGRIEEYDMSIGGQYDFRGKNVAIIGDSISTNGDFSKNNSLGNVPEIYIQTEDVGIELSAYATYYDIGTTVGGHEITSSDVGTEITFTPTAEDVGKMVGKPKNNNSATVVTWWEVAMEVLGFNPIPVCWSGSSITSHEGNDNEYKTSYAWHEAQIRKCGVRIAGTMNRTAPDVVIIYRGTNDFSHSPYTKLTDNYFSGNNWNYPDTDVLENGYGYLEGLALTVKKVKEAYPEARIVLCTMNYFKRLSTNYPGYPTRNGQNTLMEYNNAIRDAANWLGCSLIEFDKDGLSHFNAISGQYYQEGSGANSTHPNSKGHKVMGTKAMRDLISQMNSMV